MDSFTFTDHLEVKVPVTNEISHWRQQQITSPNFLVPSVLFAQPLTQGNDKFTA